MLSFLGTLGSGLFGGIGQAMNFAQNAYLQKMQNQFNLDMWNRNNEYNSPQAQMERFKSAGLNPNLIYSQGSPGLSSAPPQQNAPQGAEWSKPMQELGKAFNIENLKTIIANRKKAEADADSARTNADMQRDEYQGMKSFGENAWYDPQTGKFGFDSPFKQYINAGGPNPYGFYKMMDYMSRNFRSAELIPYRSALYEWQKRYLVPQVQMLNYERDKQPVTFLVNTIGKGVRTAADAVGIFTPKNWFVPRTSFNPYSN